MTRQTNARIAGFAFLFYIAVAYPDAVLSAKATHGDGIPAKLASIAQHTTEMRVSVFLTLLSAFSALVLAVTLYGITRDEDNEVAMFGLVCRVGEGVVGALPLSTVGLLWLATVTGPNAPDTAGASAVGAFLLKIGGWQMLTAATLFAAGSTAFSYLLLRGRMQMQVVQTSRGCMIPVAMAVLGVIGSVLVLLELPLELAGLLHGAVTQLVWIPIALFELTLGPWLLIKGVAAPTRGPPSTQDR